MSLTISRCTDHVQQCHFSPGGMTGLYQGHVVVRYYDVYCLFDLSAVAFYCFKTRLFPLGFKIVPIAIHNARGWQGIWRVRRAGRCITWLAFIGTYIGCACVIRVLIYFACLAD